MGQLPSSENYRMPDAPPADMSKNMNCAASPSAAGLAQSGNATSMAQLVKNHSSPANIRHRFVRDVSLPQKSSQGSLSSKRRLDDGQSKRHSISSAASTLTDTNSPTHLHNSRVRARLNVQSPALSARSSASSPALPTKPRRSTSRSSYTSSHVTSNSKGVCRTCTREGSKDNPLYQCTSCNRQYHKNHEGKLPSEHRDQLTKRGIAIVTTPGVHGFRCRRCLKKLLDATTFSHRDVPKRPTPKHIQSSIVKKTTAISRAVTEVPSRTAILSTSNVHLRKKQRMDTCEPAYTGTFQSLEDTASTAKMGTLPDVIRSAEAQSTAHGISKRSESPEIPLLSCYERRHSIDNREINDTIQETLNLMQQTLVSPLKKPYKHPGDSSVLDHDGRERASAPVREVSLNLDGCAGQESNAINRGGAQRHSPVIEVNKSPQQQHFSAAFPVPRNTLQSSPAHTMSGQFHGVSNTRLTTPKRDANDVEQTSSVGCHPPSKTLHSTKKLFTSSYSSMPPSTSKLTAVASSSSSSAATESTAMATRVKKATPSASSDVAEEKHEPPRPVLKAARKRREAFKECDGCGKRFLSANTSHCRQCQSQASQPTASAFQRNEQIVIEVSSDSDQSEKKASLKKSSTAQQGVDTHQSLGTGSTSPVRDISARGEVDSDLEMLETSVRPDASASDAMLDIIRDSTLADNQTQCEPMLDAISTHEKAAKHVNLTAPRIVDNEDPVEIPDAHMTDVSPEPIQTPTIHDPADTDMPLAVAEPSNTSATSTRPQTPSATDTRSASISTHLQKSSTSRLIELALESDFEGRQRSSLHLFDLVPSTQPPQTKQEIINSRMKRKQFFGSEPIHSRLGTIQRKTNPAKQNVSHAPKRPVYEFDPLPDGSVPPQDDLRICTTIEELFELPENPIPIIDANKQLAFRDGTRNVDGSLPRAKLVYPTGFGS